MPIYTDAMKLALPAILLAVLVLLLSSFDAAGPRADFTMVQPNDFHTLDPQRMTYQHDIRLARAIHEPLVIMDPERGGALPGTADRWEMSPDGLTWTFHLRPDARWSNGDPVVAQDFIDAWRRAMLPDFASNYAGFVEEIAGAKQLGAFRQGQLKAFAALPGADRTEERARQLWDEMLARSDELVSMRAPDDRTIVVTLAQPVPYWLSIVAFPVMAPVHRPTLGRFSGFDVASGRRTVDAAWTKPGTIVCNGPYVPQDWRYKRRMRLVRNPEHWDRARADVQTIDILSIADSNTAVLSYEAGGVDWVPDVRVAYKADLAEQGRRWSEHHRPQYDALVAAGKSVDEALGALPLPQRGERNDVHVIPNYGTDFYSFNCRPTLAGGAPNAFASAGVRRAFALAVDKQALAERIIRVGEPVASTLVPPYASADYPSPKGLGHDPERARQELSAAGWSSRTADGIPMRADGTPFPTVDLLYATDSPRYLELSLAMADMWRRELGVRVELRAKDSKFLKADLRSGNYMIARGGWYGDYRDPTTFLNLSRTGDGNNDRGYSNPDYDALLDRAAAERDPARRLAILADAERMAVEVDMPILPITHYATMLLYDPARIRGVTRDPSFDQRLSNIRVLRPR
jgi:oligopeptide transport system substrate-binding protein